MGNLQEQRSAISDGHRVQGLVPICQGHHVQSPATPGRHVQWRPCPATGGNFQKHDGAISDGYRVHGQLPFPQAQAVISNGYRGHHNKRG